MTEKHQQPDQASERAETTPPPSDFRPDQMVRAVSADARRELERADSGHDEHSFTKGRQAPTFNEAGLPYTTEDMDRLEQAPKGLFADTPGGAGATPLSADRHTFIENMMLMGHFADEGEAERWARAVFDALRERAIDVEDMRGTLFDQVIRVGESPEVQVQEMMWGGDYAQRFADLVNCLKDWPRHSFYSAVARYGNAQPSDPWVAAAAHSFFSALKRALPTDNAVQNLGEIQEIWDGAK